MSENSWTDCVCNTLADFCGALSPCAIPGLIEAIENHDWFKVATLIISAGECAAEIEIIIPVLAIAAVTCLLDNEGHPLDLDQVKVLEEVVKRLKNV